MIFLLMLAMKPLSGLHRRCWEDTWQLSEKRGLFDLSFVRYRKPTVVFVLAQLLVQSRKEEIRIVLDSRAVFYAASQQFIEFRFLPGASFDLGIIFGNGLHIPMPPAVS